MSDPDDVNKLADQVPEEEAQTPSETQPGKSTLEQAKRFLEQDEVRDVSTDKKIAFLESKGLEGDEIQQLLGVTRNTEATSEATSRSGSPSPPSSPPPPPSPPPAPPSPVQTSKAQSPYTLPARDAPPIITYPEFLTTPLHPTPLVTKARLLATLYIFSTISFLLYGTSNYLITPMLASLTSSRLSLLSTASGNLSKLISRLEGMVSEIPSTISGKGKNGEAGRDLDSDSDSDPTELFHRDIGVQTSLPSTPSSSATSSKPSPTNTQSNNLTGLTASLRSLEDEYTALAESTQELEATMGVLREYCDELAYVQPTTSYGFNSGIARPEEKNDEIAQVKAAIRGVKGVLLSARSFPGGVRASVR